MYPELIYDDWSPANRIRLVATFSSQTINGLACSIGLQRGENLYQILRGSHGISRDVAERIAAYYPFFSKLWLLTGDGDPLVAGFTTDEFYYQMRHNILQRKLRKRKREPDAVLTVRAMPEKLAEVLQEEEVKVRIGFPICGLWLLERIEDRQQDGSWELVTDYDSSDPKRCIRQDFLCDGIHREWHGGKMQSEERYLFDPRTGSLVMPREELWITRLTPTAMEGYHIDEDGVFRCIFRRVARK